MVPNKCCVSLLVVCSVALVLTSVDAEVITGEEGGGKKRKREQRDVGMSHTAWKKNTFFIPIW